MFYTLHNVNSGKKTPAVFLDRDGTINIEKNYLYRYEDWEWIPGTKESIKLINDAGFMVVVVSNQAGIARGKYSREDVELLHQLVLDDLNAVGAKIDAFFYCPHHPEINGECSCRKPSPEMVIRAAFELNIDLKNSWFLGDKLIDVECGTNAGVQSCFVETGYGKAEINRCDWSGKSFYDLHSFTKYLITSKANE